MPAISEEDRAARSPAVPADYPWLSATENVPEASIRSSSYGTSRVTVRWGRPGCRLGSRIWRLQVLSVTRTAETGRTRPARLATSLVAWGWPSSTRRQTEVAPNNVASAYCRLPSGYELSLVFLDLGHSFCFHGF